MRLASILAGSILLAVTVGGCAQMARTATRPFGDWRLTQVRHVNQVLPASEWKQAFTLTLREPDQASGTVACNRWNSRVSFPDRDEMRLQPPASTKMKCLIDEPAAQSFEREYLHRLGQGASYSVGQDKLTLKFADGAEWEFARQP